MADAFYGTVTRVAEILPEIHCVVSWTRDATLTLESIQACLAVVEPLTSMLQNLNGAEEGASADTATCSYA